jgi:serine/threonine-protein kinase RsbW
MAGHGLNLILESHPKNIAAVEPFVTQAVRQFDINEDLFGNMLITLTEAVSNAIIHGNCARASKQVYISTRYSGQSICFVIRDEGNGFDPNVLPDPTTPENIATPGGRGVFLMRHLCDTVTFSDGGRTVELAFSLS